MKNWSALAIALFGPSACVHDEEKFINSFHAIISNPSLRMGCYGDTRQRFLRGIEMLKMMYGLDGYVQLSKKAINHLLGITPQTRREHEKRVLRRLRHPSVSKLLEGVIWGK